MKRVPNVETIRRLEAATSAKPDNMRLDVWVCDVIEAALTKKKAASSS